MKPNDSELDYESFKVEQSLLVLLNLAVLAGLVLVHVSFLALLGLPSSLLIILVAGRFLMLIGELLWLQNVGTVSQQRWLVRVYPQLSIWFSIAFAFLASYLSGSVTVAGISDSHYSVLMVVPIIAAAFYLRLRGSLFVTAVTIVLTFLQVWLFFERHPPTDVTEYFEAATVCLIFLVVALVVSLLVSYLRGQQRNLKESLAELYKTRDRLIAEEKLAAIGRLAGGIAHEIRNPVAMISSSLNVATQEGKDSRLRAEMFQVATHEAARLEKLTGDFLQYARAKAPQLKSALLHDTLGYVASLGKAKASQLNILIRLDVPPDLHATIDDNQVQEALLNLLTNAFDATPQGGIVTLGAATNGSQELTIYVENSGEPVSDEAARRIFEPFFTTKQKGTGLGLSIVHNIARAHGGKVTLAINDPGCVRFSIVIPDAVGLSSGNGRSN